MDEIFIEDINSAKGTSISGGTPDSLVNRIEVILDIMQIKKSKFYSDLGLSKQTLPNWRKRSIPSSDILIRISNYLDVDPAWLLTGKLSTTPIDQFTGLPLGRSIVLRIFRKLSEINPKLTFENDEFYTPLNHCVSRQQLTKWQFGMQSPSLYLLYQISKSLGCTIDYLVSGKTEIPNSTILSEYEQLSEDSRNIVDSLIRKLNNVN